MNAKTEYKQRCRVPITHGIVNAYTHDNLY